MADLPVTSASPERAPRWVWRATAIFWLGFLATVLGRHVFDSLSGLLVLLLVALFLSLAIEPGVNYLAARGWRRGTATTLILGGVLLVFLAFVAAIGTLVGQQIADLLRDSDKYVNRTVDFLNDTFGTNIDAAEVIEDIEDPDGSIQRFIERQQGQVAELSVAVLGLLVQALSIVLFTFYLVADGPKLRRAICSRLPAERQRRVLATWELAIEKTGGYLYSRALLAGLSAVAHWILFQSLGTQAPVALALWVGVIGQFLPVVGTYIAGFLPVVVTFIDSPPRALVVLVFVVLYQQLENYLFLPRITARTMNIHPAIAFGSAIAGAALLGAVGAVLAIPGAAMAQALMSSSGRRHEVVDDHLTTITPRPVRRRRSWRRRTSSVEDHAPPG